MIDKSKEMAEDESHRLARVMRMPDPLSPEDWAFLVEMGDKIKADRSWKPLVEPEPITQFPRLAR